mmetsp:Transcript_8475/g.16670  ORF Transcript_8475/g.16670 Transcript_8475/m.16670 type:complete len:126 (-) Transcript_8475:308-685(-)
MLTLERSTTICVRMQQQPRRNKSEHLNGECQMHDIVISNSRVIQYTKTAMITTHTTASVLGTARQLMPVNTVKLMPNVIARPTITPASTVDAMTESQNDPFHHVRQSIRSTFGPSHSVLISFLTA